MSAKKRRLEEIQDNDDDEKLSMVRNKKPKLVHEKEESRDVSHLKQLFSLDTQTLPDRYSVYQHFRKICHAMICDLVLVFPPPSNSATLSSKVYQFVEFEFYCMDGAHHRDVFAHCDDLQYTTNASWYFHRSGNASAKGYKFLTSKQKSDKWVNPRSSTVAFRGGSFKGLDITFGAKNEVFGGILIRSIRELKPCMFTDGVLRPGDITEGPCKCVDKILHETGHRDIKALTSSLRFNLSIFYDNGRSCMYVDFASKYDIQQLSVHKDTEAFYCSPRVGLTLKAEKSLKGDALKQFQELKQEFLLAPYRCIRGSCLSKLKKYKTLIALSLVCTNYYKRKLDEKGYAIDTECANKVGPIKGKKLTALVKQYQTISAQKSDQKHKIIKDQSTGWKSTADALTQTFAALYS